MSSTTQPAGSAFFSRISASTSNSAEANRALYDEWAATYDNDLTDASHGYVGPVNAAKAILEASGGTINDKRRILDAGCGTGLSGIAVKDIVGPETIIDGIDISTGMLRLATKTGVYRKLEPADLSKALPIPDNEYDVVVCVGTLTGGHVGPIPALEEFARVCRSGGLVVGTIKESVYQSGGYEAEIKRLEDEGVVKVRSVDSVPYRAAQGVNAIMLVMMKI